MIAAEKEDVDVVNVLIQNRAKHRFDDVFPLLEPLRSLRRKGYRNCAVFTPDERIFLYNFALVL